MFNFLSGLMGGGGALAGTMPSALQGFGSGAMNMFPGMGTPDAASMAMQGGAMPNLMNPGGSVPQMPGNFGAGAPMGVGGGWDWMNNGGMPNPMTQSPDVMGSITRGPGLSDRQMMGLAAGANMTRKQPPPMAPGGGIHKMQVTPFQFGPGAQFMRRR